MILDLRRCCERSPLALLLLIVVFSAAELPAQLPTPEIATLSRQVASVGTAADVTVQGARLEELSSVIFSNFNGEVLPIKATPKVAPAQHLREDIETTNVVEVTAEAGVPTGLVELRAKGRLGISNPRSFLFTAMPVDLPTGDHSNFATAYAFKPDHLINERLTVRAANVYRILVPAGQRVRCVAYSKQLDSLADLNLRLLDPAQSQVASSRTNGMWPAEIMWSNATGAAQEMYLEVRDLLYRGGDGFHFVLEARVESSDSPAAPMHLDTLLRPRVELPLQPNKFSQPAGLTLLQRGWTAAVPIPTATIEQFPIRIQGDLQEARSIQFAAQKDQQLSFEVLSATLDQLTDPAIVVYKVVPPANNAQGAAPGATATFQQLAEQDDAPAVGTPAVRVRRLDPQLVWKATEAATYQLKLIDRQTGQRPVDSRGFLLEIRAAQPDFALVAHDPFPTNNPATSKPFGMQLMRNGSAQIHVSVLRYDGFAGSIELQVEGLPASCKCPPVIVPAGGVEADLVIQGAADAESGLASLAIVGSSKIGEQPTTRRATFAAITSAATPTYNAITSRHSGRISLPIESLDTAPLQVQLGDGNVLEVKAGGKLNLPVKLVRQPSSAAECTLRPQALPPKVGLGEFKIAADKAEASPEINVPADTPPGEYTFWLQTETKVKWRANPQALTREEAYQAKLKSALEANAIGDIPKPQIEAAVAKAATRVEELKKQTAEAEYTLFLPSNPVRIRILPKD